MQKRTDGWTGRRTDRTHGPVQTNEVRCHVPAPCCWAMQAGSGQLRGGKSGQEALASVQARYCSCSLLDVLLPRDTLVVPVRAPPSAHFRNREGSCRNRWVLLGGGRCSQEPAMGSLPIPEAASSQAPPPGTLLLFLPPTQGAYRCTIVPDNQDCHHSKSDEVTIFLAHNISDGPGTRYLAVYHVIKKYLGTANEAISIPISTISGQLAQGLVPLLDRVAPLSDQNIPASHGQSPSPSRLATARKTMPLSFSQSGFASLPPKKNRCRVSRFVLLDSTADTHNRTQPAAHHKERPTRRSLPLLYSAS